MAYKKYLNKNLCRYLTAQDDLVKIAKWFYEENYFAIENLLVKKRVLHNEGTKFFYNKKQKRRLP